MDRSLMAADLHWINSNTLEASFFATILRYDRELENCANIKSSQNFLTSNNATNYVCCSGDQKLVFTEKYSPRANLAILRAGQLDLYQENNFYC